MSKKFVDTEKWGENTQAFTYLFSILLRFPDPKWYILSHDKEVNMVISNPGYLTIFVVFLSPQIFYWEFWPKTWYDDSKYKSALTEKFLKKKRTKFPRYCTLKNAVFLVISPLFQIWRVFLFFLQNSWNFVKTNFRAISFF